MAFAGVATVLTIDDIDESEDLEVMERIGIESLELRSLSVLPLRIAGRSIGALVVGGRTPYQHIERDQRIYRSLAEQVSLRLEAARLLAQTERRARQLATSAQVSQIASSILDLNILLPRIVELIRESVRLRSRANLPDGRPRQLRRPARQHGRAGAPASGNPA